LLRLSTIEPVDARVLPEKAEPRTLTADAGPDESGARPGPLAAWRFRLAVLKYDKLVYRVARALLRDDREAEDVAQETFLRFWQLGASIERPREWLLKVARNACLDRLRRSGRLVSSETAELPEPADEHDPAWHCQREELAAQLHVLVAALPEPQRSLIVLFDMQGVDARSCAGILGLSVNQVKVYLHRARKRLRARLERMR
jgi:RNA polymerase sigma-70 factor, ECF subfamily